MNDERRSAALIQRVKDETVQRVRAFAPSPETLRAFRVRFGGTFKSYLTERLLEAAEQLAAAPEVDLAEIVTGLGFREVELFSRWFKRWTGDTPEQRCPARAQKRPGKPAAAGPSIALWLRSRAWALCGADAAALAQALRAQRSGIRSS